MDRAFTTQQATDLARHFLGGEWRATIQGGACILVQGPTSRFVGATWREVFRAAGVSLPVRKEFASVGRRVMYGADAVANCVSNTMAQRVAHALNAFDPDRRGK